MPSTYSASGRFTLQATGENNNVWGSVLNTGTITLIDFSIFGWTTKALTGNYSLTTASGAADEARSAILKFTGAGTFTVTIPNVSKRYDVWNATTGVLTITNGSVSVTLQVGEVVSIITDGSTGMKRVVPTDFGGTVLTNLGAPSNNTDAATKLYVDNTAFNMAAGALPGQVGNAGKVLTTDGTTASWGASFTNLTLTTPTISNPTVTGGQTLSGGLTFTGSTKQNVTAMAALDCDLSTGEFFTKSISTNSTFTFSNAVASKAQAFAVKLTISSAAVPAWPAVVKWSNGTVPTLGNGTHVLGFLSFDGGTTWTGVLVSYNYS